MPPNQSNQERVARRRIDKFSERRKELAGAAMQALANLGYARTSLREIAQNSDFSHGVLHYYFADKVALITFCVKLYKEECVTRYDQIVATAASADELKRGFAAALAQTLREDISMHRLWYDLRNQSLFDDAFREDVVAIDESLERMIWRIVSQYAQLAGVAVPVRSPTAYAVFDGLFQQALLHHAWGREGADEALEQRVENIIGALLR